MTIEKFSELLAKKFKKDDGWEFLFFPRNDEQEDYEMVIRFHNSTKGVAVISISSKMLYGDKFWDLAHTQIVALVNFIDGVLEND